MQDKDNRQFLLERTGGEGKKNALEVDNMIMQTPHTELSNPMSVRALTLHPVSTLEISRSGESDFDGSVELEGVVKEVIVAVRDEPLAILHVVAIEV
jgi:hypothetical protein